jgi:hypothetical protein
MNIFKTITRMVKTAASINSAAQNAKNTSARSELNAKTLTSMISQLLQWVKSDNGIVTLLVALSAVALWLALGGDSDFITAGSVIVAGTAGGKHIADGPLTTSLSEEASPGLLRNEIDDRIVKIRPMSTPIDQISRWGGCRACGSMVVDYYSVDTKPTSTTLAETYEADGSPCLAPVELQVTDANIFEPSETILVPTVAGTDESGTAQGSLVLYVTSRGSKGELYVLPVNSRDSAGNTVMPDIPQGASLIRMGRAAAELDVQTAQFEALPQKAQNYCQIFKAQVEQSTFQKIANKEVGWGFNDQEEVAIIDMRLGMEKNFLFGVKARVYDPEKRDEIMLTGGIWDQAPRSVSYPQGTITNDKLVEITRLAFTHNAGSSRKILIGGTLLIDALNRMDITRVASPGDKVTKWGIDFTEITTKFGTLYVLASEVFDECGHSHDGMIIDPEYITKYCHVPFRTEKLDLRSSGVRNTDAIVITEASCLVLRYPQAHLKLIAEPAKATIADRASATDA